MYFTHDLFKVFLTKIRYAEPDIDVQLSEELSGSLRTLKVCTKQYHITAYPINIIA